MRLHSLCDVETSAICRLLSFSSENVAQVYLIDSCLNFFSKFIMMRNSSSYKKRIERLTNELKSNNVKLCEIANMKEENINFKEKM